jgi:hypothetical protein
MVGHIGLHGIRKLFATVLTYVLKDATPKKRGPKTDVLEALLKRVNGLEKRLKDENRPEVDELAIDDSASIAPDATDLTTENGTAGQTALQVVVPHTEQGHIEAHSETALQSIAVRRDSYAVAPEAQGINNSFTDTLIDTYFSRLHGKPYYILDEPATRQRRRDNQLPRYVVNAIHAATIKYASHLCGGHNGAVYSSQELIIYRLYCS